MHSRAATRVSSLSQHLRTLSRPSQTWMRWASVPAAAPQSRHLSSSTKRAAAAWDCVSCPPHAADRRCLAFRGLVFRNFVATWFKVEISAPSARTLTKAGSAVAQRCLSTAASTIVFRCGLDMSSYRWTFPSWVQKARVPAILHPIRFAVEIIPAKGLPVIVQGLAALSNLRR